MDNFIEKFRENSNNPIKNIFSSNAYSLVRGVLKEGSALHLCNMIIKQEINFSSKESEQFTEALKIFRDELIALQRKNQLTIGPSKTKCQEFKVKIHSIFKNSQNIEIRSIFDKHFTEIIQAKGEIVRTNGRITSFTENVRSLVEWIQPQRPFYQDEFIDGEFIIEDLKIKNQKINKSVRQISKMSTEVIPISSITIGSCQELKIDWLEAGCTIIVEGGGFVDVEWAGEGSSIIVMEGGDVKVRVLESGASIIVESGGLGKIHTKYSGARTSGQVNLHDGDNDW